MSSEADTIVVGVDGSEASSHALAWAVEQAAAEHRQITLVHAIHPGTPAWLDPSAHDPREARRLALMTKGQEMLATVRSEARLPPGVTVEDLVRIGDPREVLLELSRTASMLVVGSRGMGPLKSLLLGSTSVAVLRHAECPVVVHRPVAPGAARHGIAVGVDVSPDALIVLDFAFRQARLHDEPLSIVHTSVLPPAVPPDDKASAVSWTDDESGVGMAAQIAELSEKYPDVHVETLLGQGTPEHFLLGLADHVGLMVVGVHHHSGIAELTFGSMAVWLVEHAACPVAAVPLSGTLASEL